MILVPIANHDPTESETNDYWGPRMLRLRVRRISCFPITLACQSLMVFEGGCIVKTCLVFPARREKAPNQIGEPGTE
jgi:hypothetical protein